MRIEERIRRDTTCWSPARAAVEHRRKVAVGAALVVSALTVAGCGGSSQSGGGSGSHGANLASLQKAGTMTVGIAQEPPYSSLTPSGSVTGVGPEVTQAALSQLGVSHVTGKVATYGELIPGLQAGRWSMISGTLTMSAARCKAVRFSYPITVGTDAFSHMKSFTPPSTFKQAIQEAKAGKIKIGVAGSGDNYSRTQDAGITAVVFPTVVAAEQGMEAGRVQLVFDDRNGLLAEQKIFGSRIDVTPTLPDIPPTFSSVSFPRDATQFADKFDASIRKLKASGDFTRILKKWGFSIPAKYASLTGDQACQQLEKAGS